MVQFSQGVFSQKFWRQVQDVDDCGPLADFMCVHAVAPWAQLPGITAYRAAAGNPDDPTHADGVNVSGSAKAIRTLWPQLRIELVLAGKWLDLMAALTAGRPVSLSVKAGSLPNHGSFLGGHRVAAYKSGATIRILDPLKRPHSLATVISELALKKAVYDLSSAGVYAVVFPTVEEAFLTHPLHP